MSLQNLINQYVVKMKDIDRLIEEKALIQMKLENMNADRMNLRKEMMKLFFKNDGSVKTFLVTVDDKPTVCQIDLSLHPDHNNFLTFCEVTPIEELEQVTAV